MGLDSKKNEHRFLWEHRPAIYLIVGAGCIVFSRGSWILIVSGIVFLLCSAWVFRMRKEYRKDWDKKPPGKL